MCSGEWMLFPLRVIKLLPVIIAGSVHPSSGIYP